MRSVMVLCEKLFATVSISSASSLKKTETEKSN